MIRRTAATTAVTGPFITATSFEFACASAFIAVVALISAAVIEVMTS